MVYRKYDRHNNYETSFYEKFEISKKKKKKKKKKHITIARMVKEVVPL